MFLIAIINVLYIKILIRCDESNRKLLNVL